jgi:dihydrolipoamide dehydrogenase
VIVGATFTGVDVAESLHAATIAVIGEVPLERLWHAVPCFPTRSECWQSARRVRPLMTVMLNCG